MKYLLIILTRKWRFPFFIFFLLGCASQAYVKEHVGDWMARPISELKQSMKSPDSYASKIGWKESTYRLANGNSVYIEPFDENCLIHWETSPRGTIIGYRTEGSGCGQEYSSASFLRALTPPPQ